jgi:zinc/manganese transport system permease protein
LPVLGCFLRLRDEWLAALAYAHVAAAGALLALVGGAMPAARWHGRRWRWPVPASDYLPAAGRWCGICLAAAGRLGGRRAAGCQPAAGRAPGHALFDGQLYFSGGEQLWLVAVCSLMALLLLRKLANNLLLAHVYPDFFRVRGLPAWPTQTGFDLLAALVLALATMSIGRFCFGLYPPLAGFPPGA